MSLAGACRAHRLHAVDDASDGPAQDHVAVAVLHGDLVGMDARVVGKRLHDGACQRASRVMRE
jgi:hypothetical protein